jgi:hypothetical protein
MTGTLEAVVADERYREVAASADVAGLPESGRPPPRRRSGARSSCSRSCSSAPRTPASASSASASCPDGSPSSCANCWSAPGAEFVSRVRPQVDAVAVARAASADASQRLHELAGAILADVDDEQWSPAAADLDELHERLETVWRAWRAGLRRTME